MSTSVAYNMHDKINQPRSSTRINERSQLVASSNDFEFVVDCNLWCLIHAYIGLLLSERKNIYLSMGWKLSSLCPLIFYGAFEMEPPTKVINVRVPCNVNVSRKPNAWASDQR